MQKISRLLAGVDESRAAEAALCSRGSATFSSSSSSTMWGALKVLVLLVALAAGPRPATANSQVNNAIINLLSVVGFNMCDYIVFLAPLSLSPCDIMQCSRLVSSPVPLQDGRHIRESGDRRRKRHIHVVRCCCCGELLRCRRGLVCLADISLLSLRRLTLSAGETTLRRRLAPW